MAEQLGAPLNTEGLAKLTPEQGRPPEPVELTKEEDQELMGILEEAREAENQGQTALAVELLQRYRSRYESLRQQRIQEKRAEQGELGQETLQKNQKSLDLIFGEGRFNLQREYEQGHIQGLSQEQLKAMETSPEEEKYSELVIIPGQIPREEVIQAIDKRYQELFGQPISYANEADLSQTQAAKKNSRPEGFYVIAVQRQKETVDLSPKTTDQTLTVQLETLQKAQKKNPNLNLKGMTLSEAMLLDAYFYANEGTHADDSSRKWSYNRCLEELILDDKGQPARALSLGWVAVLSRLGVFSDSGADSDFGARFAAVSASSAP